MSSGQVIQSRGAEVRAAGELNVLKNESNKRVKAESTLGAARVQEKDARSGEADGSKKKYIDSWYQKQSADLALEAAKDAKMAAIFGAISSIAGSVGSAASSKEGFDFGNTFSIVATSFSAFMSVAGAFLAAQGAKAEAQMIGKLFGQMSAEGAEDDKNMKALDGNATR
ncbi:MAG: hypothetical protein AABZ74_04230 [Cyanobacteriota bacterium]